MKKITAVSLCICFFIMSCFIPVSADSESLPLDCYIDFEGEVSFSNQASSLGDIGIYNEKADDFNADNVFSGKASFFINHNSSKGNLNMRFRDIQLKAGNKYRLSFRYKASADAWFYFVKPNSKSPTLKADGWQYYETDITAETDINYFEIGTTAVNTTVYIDEMSIKEVHSISVASANDSLGTVGISAAESLGTGTVTFNAYPEYGCGFTGWTDANGNTVSQSAEYSINNITSDISLTAVFYEKEKGIKENDFESKPTVTASGNGKYEYINDGSSAHSGNGALKLTHNSQSGNFSIKIFGFLLEKQTEYEVSFYYKANKRVWIYADSSSNGEFVSAEDWTLYKVKICPESRKTSLQVGVTTTDAEIYIDDLKIKNYYEVNANSLNESCGTATVTPEIAAYGDTVTFHADANYGYVFSGWRNEYGKIVSQSADFRPAVLDNITLTAVFSNKESNDSFIGFEDDTDIAVKNYSAGNAEITSEISYNGNKSFKMTSNSARGNLYVWFGDVSLKAGQSYKISFMYKSSVQGSWGYIYDNTNNSLGINFTVSDDWQKIDKTVTCTKNTDYLELGTVAPGNVLYIDNIEVKKLYNVAVSADDAERGTVTPASSTQTFGQKIKLNAVPKKGYAFVGYFYENSKKLSNEAEYELTVYGDIDITAVFEKRCDSDKHTFYISSLQADKKGYICENCGYSYFINDINSDGKVDIRDLVREKQILSGNIKNYNQFSADCDENGELNANDIATLRRVLLGTVNLKYDVPEKQKRTYDYGFNGNNYISFNTDKYCYNNSAGSLYVSGSDLSGTASYKLTTMYVKPFTKYTLSAYVYGISCKSDIQLNLSGYDDYAYISGNSATYSGKWNKLEFKFNTGNIETNEITPVLIVYPGNKFYFDELTLTENKYDGTYSEKLYNAVWGGDFETDEFAADLSGKAEIVNDNRAASGSKMLSLNKKSSVAKSYTLSKPGRYRFAVSYIADESGTLNVTLLSGNRKYQFSSETQSVMNRRFFDFIVEEENTEVKINIESEDSVLLDDIYIFMYNYAYAENPNVYGKKTVVPITRQAVLNASPTYSLSINSAALIQDDYMGNTGVYYAFNYIPEKYDRKYSSEMQRLELERIKNAGVSVVRTQYSPCWAWNTVTSKWDYNTEEMQGFYKYLDDMKALGIDVAIQIGWDVSDVTSSRLTSYSFNPFYILSGGDSTKAESYYAEWVSNSVKTLHSKGYDNVKYLVAFTEPSTALTTEDYTRDIETWKHYVMLAHNKMAADGVRKSVKILGFNMGAYNRKTSPVDDFLALKYMAGDSELCSAVDIFTYHIYVTSENTADNYSEWYHYMSEAVKIASSVGKKLWFDEGEWISSDDTDWNEKASYGIYGTQLALKTVAAMNSGLQTSMRWTIADQYWTNLKNTNSAGEWQNGCHLDGLLPNLNSTSIPRKSYYAYSLIGKYTAGMKNVYSGTNDGSLYITSCSDGKGGLTVIVVNMGNTAADFSVSGISGFNAGKLYRHIYDYQNIIPDSDAEIINADAVIEGISDKFTDSLPKYSFAVYTTIG